MSKFFKILLSVLLYGVFVPALLFAFTYLVGSILIKINDIISHLIFHNGIASTIITCIVTGILCTVANTPHR